jgi:hypothetical protein
MISAAEVPMLAAIQIPESRRAEIEEFAVRQCSKAEFRRFLCVWLRVEGGMSAAGISKAVKWSAHTVRVVQRRFIESSVASFADGRRAAGPRRGCPSRRRRSWRSSLVAPQKRPCLWRER